MKIDFSKQGLGMQYDVYISPQSRVTGLNLINSPNYVFSWWINIPQYLCELDFSNLVPTNTPDVFQKLTQILASSPEKLALQSLNISNIITIPQSVVQLIEVCLLCPMIQLIKLDITGICY